MAKEKNIMATHAVEAMGLRIIAMFVQEYYHWGWQPYAQENDDGIDGEIIPRFKNGVDKGVRIFVQSKAGKGYLSSKNENTINISPYSSKEQLCNHIGKWNKFHEPVLLIYTNAEKTDRNGHHYTDIKNPTAWWIRMDEYIHDGSSIVKIPLQNLFQEHTKGILERMIKPFIKDWIHYPLINPPSKKVFNLWYSEKLQDESKTFYRQWAKESTIIKFNGRTIPIKVSRIGWRHITYKKRKNRVQLSKKLLPIAKEILMETENIRPVLLRSTYSNNPPWNSIVEHIGYRARVNIEGIERKVQVVLKRYRNMDRNTEKWWFYSVHIIK